MYPLSLCQCAGCVCTCSECPTDPSAECPHERLPPCPLHPPAHQDKDIQEVWYLHQGRERVWRGGEGVGGGERVWRECGGGCTIYLHQLILSIIHKKMQRDCYVPYLVKNISTFPPVLPLAGLDLPAGIKCWGTAPPNPPSSPPRVRHIHPSLWNLRKNRFWLPQWTQQFTRSVRVDSWRARSVEQ